MPTWCQELERGSREEGNIGQNRLRPVQRCCCWLLLLLLLLVKYIFLISSMSQLEYVCRCRRRIVVITGASEANIRDISETDQSFSPPHQLHFVSVSRQSLRSNHSGHQRVITRISNLAMLVHLCAVVC